MLAREDKTSSGTVAPPGPIIKLSMPPPCREALKHIEQAFLEEGFEISQRVAISTLVKDRLGVDVPPTRLLFLVHPVLAFQALLAGDEATTLLELFIVVKTSPDESSSVSFYAASPDVKQLDGALTRFVAQQAHARLLRAAHRLRQLPSSADQPEENFHR